MIRIYLLALGVFALSAGLTGAFRRFALRRNLMDVPNERSSHTVPTPRGGGLAIVVGFLGGALVLGAWNVVSWRTIIAVAGAGTLAAWIGFLDDRRSVASGKRLLVHFLAGAWGVGWLGGMAPLTLGGVAHDLGIVGGVLAVVGLAWLLNLYNFMDGIDGIAAIEAVSVCLSATILAKSTSSVGALALPLVLAAASAGFLVWNYPPAKIFMGDAGSGFLGLVLGLIAMSQAHDRPALFWSWLILLAAFIVDASITLLGRARRRIPLHQAHREHAYQHASRRLGRHAPVTLAIAAINVLWLLPIAWLVAGGRINEVLGTAIAYTPLLAAAVALRAGRPWAGAGSRLM